MLSDITIGQYFPGRSLLHRLDPRIKVVLTLLFVVLVFVPHNWPGLLAAAAYLILAVALSGVPVRLIFKSFKPLLPVIVLTAVLNIFYTSSGAVLWQWKFFHITTGGLINAAFLAARILCLIAGSSLLTYTTTPTSLTDALERLLSPLSYLHVPVHEIAMMMTIALRFIPTLIEETDKIMSAQKARGADMESGGIIRRIKGLIPVLIPLFVSSFRRAYELAVAMECRCYHGGGGRTRMIRLHLAARDFLCLGITVLLLALVIALNILLPSVLG